MSASFNSYLLRALLISAVAAALAFAAIFLTSRLLFPLDGVKVYGARMLPKSEVRALASSSPSLLTLNTRALKEKIKANPWVEGVSVRKDWRSSIVVVKVQERRPILYGEVEGKREILSADGKELPGLGGTNLKKVALARDQVGEVLGAARTFEENGVRLDSIDGVGPGGFSGTVGGRPVIFSEGVERDQVLALGGVMRRNPNARAFDLRSPDRVVVSGSVEGVGTYAESDRKFRG